MLIIKKKYILIFILFLSFVVSKAQETDIKFETISLEEGLSQSSVRCIIQDYKGFMWIGTLDGLNKYDGYTITNYHFNNHNPYSIADNTINALFEDSEKNLWIGTRLGLCKYDRTKDRFIRIDTDRKQITGSVITSIVEDQNGFLWIGTTSGLNKYNKKTGKFKTFKFNFLDPNSISNNQIFHIFFDKRNYLWLATNEGLNRFDLKTEKSVTFKFPREKSDFNRVNYVYVTKSDSVYIGTDYCIAKLVYDNNNPSKFYFEESYLPLEETVQIKKTPKNIMPDLDFRAKCMVEDPNNVLWIGSEKNGLVMFNPKTKKFKTYKYDPAKRKSLSVNNILTLYQDRTNILWVGTYLGGVNKWNRAADDLDIFRHNPYDPNSLSSNQVRSIYQDRNDNIWIGTVDGGLNKWNKKESKFSHYKNDRFNLNSLPHNHVRSMLHDSKNRFWIGTDGGGLAIFYPEKNKFVRYEYNQKNKTGIGSDKIWKIYEDSKGNIWVGTSGGGLNLYKEDSDTFKKFKHKIGNKKSLSNNDVTTILEDSKGRLWVGTLGGGLNYFNYSDSSFVCFQYVEGDSTSLSDDRIYSVFEDTKKNIWIGTKGGLNLYLPKINGFKVFTKQDELPNDVVMGILEDSENNLWLSTNGGLCKFNKKTGVIRSFDVKDGLQSNEFLVGSFCKARNGEMFFGGINGFNAFFPEKIKDNQNPPSIVITGFRIMNKDVELDTIISEKKHLYLSWEDNVFSFEFVALDYIFPEKNRYKIKMEGYVDEWIDFGTRRYVSYTNLPAGRDYIFRVIGSNNDGIWNTEGTSIIIHIAPPWWQTTWARVTGLVLFIASVLSWVKYREQKLKHDKRVLEEAVNDRTKQIREKNIELAQKTKDITDSIEYASRIQNAILPPETLLKETLSDYFVLFKPRDIVSGDYYWMTRKENITVIAAADCTGHGVPGAFMSMLGIAFLNEIVNKIEIVESHVILNQLRDYVKKSLNQKGAEGEAKDGMDIALCVIDHQSKSLEFSGAFNPLLIVRDGDIIEIKADKMPIGIYEEDHKSFTKNNVEIKENDSLYIYSDGYVDQFGGPKGKKFFSKQFKNLLLEINDKTMPQQKQFLWETLEKWKGDLEQVDDILVIGMKII